MNCRCGREIPEIRIKLNYKTCVKCSTTQAYSCVPIINGKTGNTIQIVSPEQAEVVKKSLRRRRR
jgi:hypothetical protein